MRLEAGHWTRIESRVKAHAEKLHPNDEEKQRELYEHLLCITSRKSLEKRGRAADAALSRMNKELETPQPGTLRSLWKKLVLAFSSP